MTDRRRVLTTGASLAGLMLAGCAAGAPEKPKQTRKIPFDLWTGVDGAEFGAPLNTTRGNRTIRGPLEWRHPITGRTIRIYELLDRDDLGDKIQYYTLNADKSALARVFDSRPGKADRTFTGDAFFPLGPWREDERRAYNMTTYQHGTSREYVGNLIIRRLSREYRGVPDSLRFDWRLEDLNGNRIFDERYDYSPGVGFVRFRNRMA